MKNGKNKLLLSCLALKDRDFQRNGQDIHTYRTLEI